MENIEYVIKLTETRHRLLEWGAWNRATLLMGLNYSSQSIVSQLIDVKGLMIRSTSENLSPDNKRAEEVDVLINKLAKEDLFKAKLISYHYTMVGTIFEKANAFSMKKTNYLYHLSQAERWINDRIS